MRIDVASRLEPAERRRWRELLAFEDEKPRALASLMRLATAPLEALIPEAAKQKVVAGLGSLLRVLQDASSWTASPAAILEAADAEGQGSTLAELAAEAEIERVLAWADALMGPSQLQAMIQGVGLGMGGLLLAASDIPLLLTLHLRMLTRMGFCFGFDLRSPAERPWLLELLALGYSLSDLEAKRAAQAVLDARLAADEPAGGGSDELTRTLVLRAAATFADKVGPILLRRKASSMVPVLGSALAAGANYLLTRDVAAAGRHGLAKRLLYNRARARTHSSR